MSCIKILLVVVIFMTLSVDKTLEQYGDSKEQVMRAPPLKPSQLEFSKKFWKDLGEQQKGGDKKVPQQRRGKGKKKKPTNYATERRPSGDFQFIDGVMSVFFPVGDRYGGVPSDIVGMGMYCVQFLINGIIAIAYTTIRFPQKILLKTMVAMSALAWIPTNGLFCLNPLSILNFVKKGTLINEKADELADLHDEFKKRLANSIDKFGSMMKMQKHACCAWFDWKRKTLQTVPPQARDFLAQWWTAFFKIDEVIYCQIFSTDHAAAWCKEFDFMDMDPPRVLPRSWITLVMELFTRFF